MGIYRSFQYSGAAEKRRGSHTWLLMGRVVNCMLDALAKLIGEGQWGAENPCCPPAFPDPAAGSMGFRSDTLPWGFPSFLGSSVRICHWRLSGNLLMFPLAISICSTPCQTRKVSLDLACDIKTGWDWIGSDCNSKQKSYFAHSSIADREWGMLACKITTFKS